MSALDKSKRPYIMPVVGYSGHIRGLADADQNFGGSHWKNSGEVTGNKSAASMPWDGRDVVGRPHGGWTPGDGGVIQVDPEWEQKKREADEANEILELRSMGIRAMLKKDPSMGGSHPGTKQLVAGQGSGEIGANRGPGKKGDELYRTNAMGIQRDY